MSQLEALKEKVYRSDNTACFIERERILSRLAAEGWEDDSPDCYARILSRLLDEVSTPIEAEDVFLGRVVEAVPDEGMTAPSWLLASTGHMSYRYDRLLRLGLKGIVAETEENALRLGDEKSRQFAHNARIVAEAVRRYASRYALAAEKAGKPEAAAALRRVPYEPAANLFEALQSVWLLHMLASCYVGSRDFAFGKFDEYMLPYYEAAVTEGRTREDIVDLLAAFFVKTDEICGRATHNYHCKPTPSQASKQYVILGGARPNELSTVILEAAERLCMAQPQFTVLLSPDAEPAFTSRVFAAMSRLTDKLHIYNYDLIRASLLRQGLPEEVASDFTFSACCTFDLHYHTVRREFYVPALPLFCETLTGCAPESVEALAAAYSRRIGEFLQGWADTWCGSRPYRDNLKAYVLDALLIGECTERCRYPEDGGLAYNLVNLFFPGIATLGDSLAAVDKMVFQEKRYTWEEFCRIVRSDYAGEEALRLELEGMTKFGNDTDADDYAVMAANALLDAVETLRLPPEWYAVSGFYSLERENTSCADVPATPDGRHAGTPFSENQSPVYGGDKNGITALLKSLSRLPFSRAVSGGLNLTFFHEQSPAALEALLLTYFEMGGLHAGITVTDRRTLEEARLHPEKHKNLTVRLYGFSEYFISLPDWQQDAVIRRTAY